MEKKTLQQKITQNRFAKILPLSLVTLRGMKNISCPVWKKSEIFTLFSIFSWADLKSLRTEDLDSDDEFFRETTDMLSSSKKLESLKKGKKIRQIKLTKKITKYLKHPINFRLCRV